MITKIIHGLKIFLMVRYGKEIYDDDDDDDDDDDPHTPPIVVVPAARGETRRRRRGENTRLGAARR